MTKIGKLYEEQYLKSLQKVYVFCRDLYSMSFRQRLLFELGVFRVQTYVSEEIKNLPKEEIEKRIKELKKPWWNWLFFWK